MALTIKMNIHKVRRSFLLSVFVTAAVSVAACTNTPEVKPPASPSPVPAATTSPASSPAASPSGSPAATSKVDSLVGKWSGPEGTSVNVAKKGDKYSIEITGPGGMKAFEGSAKGDAIEFTRNGKTETIKAATGAETGMKDLEKETNCVVINKGSEGFCKK